jgi:hypothetical protein
MPFLFLLSLFKGLIMETVNELIYTPKGERDYGTLACWGTNSIGKQMEPCLFQVVPAGMYKQTFWRIIVAVSKFLMSLKGWEMVLGSEISS